MENMVSVFENDEFGKIRVVVIDGEPWFVASDIAKNLGYRMASDMARRIDNEDKGTHQVSTPSGVQNMTIINESGLYSSILASKLDSAKRFKHWVTSDVLPTIRRTGGYINNVDLMVNTYFSDIPDDQKTLVKGLMTNIVEKEKKMVVLNNENDLLTQKNLEWADRSLINSLVRAYAAAIDNNFGKAWNDFKKELLYKYGINLNSRITNHLNSSGKKTKPRTLDMLDDSELSSAISTAVSMCRENNVNIDDLLSKKAS